MALGILRKKQLPKENLLIVFSNVNGTDHPLIEKQYEELLQEAVNQLPPQQNKYDQDIRNAEYNIIRDFKVNNPASAYNGQWILKDKVPLPLKSYTDNTRNFFPVIAKVSNLGDHPKEL